MMELTEKCLSELFNAEYRDNRLKRWINSRTGSNEVGEGTDVDFKEREGDEETNWAVHHDKWEKSLETEVWRKLECRKIHTWKDSVMNS